MIFSTNLITPTKIKRTAQAACSSSIILIFMSMSVLAFDGTTESECIDYVYDGCSEEPKCTAEEAEFLFGSCDIYPDTVKAYRPSFTAKPSSKKVVKSLAYKKKIKQLKADIRRK